jgi:hypothetical protein
MLDGFLGRVSMDSNSFQQVSPLKNEFRPLHERFYEGRNNTLDTAPVAQEVDLTIPHYWQAFYRRSLDLVLTHSDIGLPEEFCKTPETLSRWFQEAFHHVFISTTDVEGTLEKKNREFLKLALYQVGVIKENALGNWEINRPGGVLAESLGLRSIPETIVILSDWINEPSLVETSDTLRSTPKSAETVSKRKKPMYFERGPGDGRNVDWIRKHFPELDCRSVGMLLHFSVVSLLHGFVHPELQDDPDVTMFLRVLSIFLMREINSQESDEKNINSIFPLLANMGEWIRKYCDKENGFYVDSTEFEFDTLKKLEDVSHHVVEMFRDFNWFFSITHFRFDYGCPSDKEEDRLETIRRNKTLFLGIFKKFFRKDFCDEIARHLFDTPKADGEEGIDLRKILPVYPTGFTQAYFTEIGSLLTKEDRITFATDVRASSHESNDDFQRDVDVFLDHLEYGGALSLDGGRESYTRDDRADLLQNIVQRKNAALGREEYRCYAIVDKGSPEGTRARAIWIGRAKEDGRFLPADRLAKCINTDVQEIVRLEDYNERFIIRFESEVRRIFKRVFMDKFQDLNRVKQQFGNDEVKKAIEYWVVLVSDPSRRPSALSVEDVILYLKNDIKRYAIFCSHDEPQMKEIPFSSAGFDFPSSPTSGSLRQIIR